MTQRSRIAVIGAGLSGLACAKVLGDAGFPVTVFDKGRRPGGRLATREVDGGTFDHGAQFLNPQSPEFARFVEESGNAVRWRALSEAGKSDTHVFQPATNALAAGLAQSLPPGVDVVAATEIRTLSPLPGKTPQWTLAASDGRRFEPFDEIVITIPAPQAHNLLERFSGPFEPALENVAYDPCMVAMIAFPEPIPAPGPILEPSRGEIALAVRDSAKPGRAHRLDCWVVQAGLAWSRAHADDERPAIAAALLGAFRDLAPASRDIEPAHLEGHRWRYALVTRPVGEPCLREPQAKLTLAGDYMLGAGAEHAYLSGVAAARAILRETAA